MFSGPLILQSHAFQALRTLPKLSVFLIHGSKRIQAAEDSGTLFHNSQRFLKGLLTNSLERLFSDNTGCQGLCHLVIHVIFVQDSRREGYALALQFPVQGNSLSAASNDKNLWFPPACFHFQTSKGRIVAALGHSIQLPDIILRKNLLRRSVSFNKFPCTQRI